MIQMTTKKSESTLVGLEIEAGSVAAAEIRTNGTPKLLATAIAPLGTDVFHEGEVTDPDALAEALRQLFAEHKLSRRVRLGIANQWVVVRTLRLPAIEDPTELETAVRFQAQEQIPMPLDQAILDHRVVGGAPPEEGAPPKIDVVVVAARRDMIASLLKPLRSAGLDPIGVDLSAFGLIRALGGSAPAAQPAGEAAQVHTATLYCHLGDVSNLAVAKGRSCLFTRVSPVGLEGFGEELSASTGAAPEHSRMWLSHVGLGAPVSEIEGDPNIVAAARSTLELGASSLLDEIRLSLDFYGAQEGAVPVDRVVLCGPGSVIGGLAEEMQSVLGIPIEVGRPEALSGLDQAQAARLTLSYGLALER